MEEERSLKTTTLEEFLGKLYADADAQARFRSDPAHEAQLAGLSDEDYRALTKMDWAGFELACRSFERKRSAKSRQQPAGIFGFIGRKLRRVMSRG